jgi:hypothetical protein
MAAESDLEQKILMSLEEAGEDHLSALLNTVIDASGNPDEIASFRTALTSLIEEDLLRLARSRQAGPASLKPLSQPESVAVLAHLKAFLVWSPPENLWKWNEDASSRMDVVLTDEGIAAARRAAAGETE